MASRVTLKSAMSDGTNIFTEMEIQVNGVTQPTIRPVFRVGTAASTITTYMQNLATNGSAIASDIEAIVGSSATA